MAAAWAYRALDIRGAKADLAGTWTVGASMSAPRCGRSAAPPQLRCPASRAASAATPADETTAPLVEKQTSRFHITRKDIVAASDQDMEGGRT